MNSKLEDEISIPSEAIAYIEMNCSSDPFKYEVIELFFEWLGKQDKATVIRILREVLE
jgi:hypothetical protein